MRSLNTVAVQEDRRHKARRMLRALRHLVPEAGMILRYATPWELLVAVMLSAQCTDAQVNKVTKTLFATYPTLDAYLAADPHQFEHDIYSTGFYKQKATHILATARRIHDDYGGIVPRSIDELTVLPGVGRKTANVVLGNAYGVVEGIAVDTHVRRFALQFGLTRSTDPVQIEQDLMQLLPRKDWFSFTYYAIAYGRQYCTARCTHDTCPLRDEISTQPRR